MVSLHFFTIKFFLLLRSKLSMPTLTRNYVIPAGFGILIPAYCHDNMINILKQLTTKASSLLQYCCWNKFLFDVNRKTFIVWDFNGRWVFLGSDDRLISRISIPLEYKYAAEIWCLFPKFISHSRICHDLVFFSYKCHQECFVTNRHSHFYIYVIFDIFYSTTCKLA